MKIGQTVTMDRGGQQHAVTIIEVGESGASGYKALSVAWKDAEGSHTRSDLPHERDAAKGAHFWREGNPRQNQAGEPAIAIADEAPKKTSTTKK